MKKNLLLFILFFNGILSFAQIQISDKTVGVDEQNHLIVINQDIEWINNSISDEVQDITILGKVYSFSEPIKTIEKGRKYTASIDNVDYALFFSSLPIIKMSTQGEIMDSPDVPGNFELLFSDEVQISSHIGVQYRGKSSQSYPKKSMEVAFWTDESGEDTVDYSVLGLANEDAFNLQAIYNENLRINSKSASELWLLIHPEVSYSDKEPDAKSGIEMKYVDLFLNGEYRGIYAAGEKIKRKFLKLKKFGDEEIKGELYKSSDFGGATSFKQLNPYDNNSDYWDGYEYKYPKDLIDWANLYEFVGFVIDSDKATFDADYSKKFNVDNAVDYLIFISTLRATDNMLKNIYLAKYKKNDPYFYIPWDLDGSFGSIWDGSNENIYDDLFFNGLYARLWQDKNFRVKLSERWKALRATIIKKEEISNLLTNNYQLLKNNGAYEREKIKWNEHDFLETQLQYHADWVGNRINFLDTVFIYNDMGTSEETSTQLKVYPNPATSYFYLDVNQAGDSQIKIIDYAGNQIKAMSFTNISKTTRIPVSDLPSGVYFVIFKSKNIIQTSKLVVK